MQSTCLECESVTTPIISPYGDSTPPIMKWAIPLYRLFDWVEFISVRARIDSLLYRLSGSYVYMWGRENIHMQ